MHRGPAPLIVCRIVVLAVCLHAASQAQEGGGYANLGFQQYYLTVGSQQVYNIFGLSMDFTQFVPGVGLFSGSFSPALNNNRFRTGDDFLRLKGLPWMGQYWTIGVGDFRSPGQLVQSPFTNLYIPEIAGRGVSATATHGGRTIGFFYGDETIANSPRVVLRVVMPQTVMGLYLRQKIGKRLMLGTRVVRYSNDVAALAKMPSLLPQQAGNLKSVETLNLYALCTIAGPLKWYNEVAASRAPQTDGTPSGVRDLTFSVLAGPALETKPLTVRLNYASQSATYFPMLGFYAGDRRGPSAEVKIHPLHAVEIYGAASEYQNNVARDPALPTYRSSGVSGGIALQLPVGVSLNAQVSQMDLSTRINDASPWQFSRNRQQLVSVTRRFGRQTIRLSSRDLTQTLAAGPQRQRSGEVEDNFRIRRLSLGAGIRVQRSVAQDARTSLFYRGSAQFQLGPVSFYSNVEMGRDMLNSTLFATNTISTTVIGAGWRLGRNWDMQAEAFRNNLVTELNPQNIFVLQGQGVYIPGTLAAINQWSVYLRVTHSLRWGKGGSVEDLANYSLSRAPLKGAVEGFVMERLFSGNYPADGVPVSLDHDRTVTTDATGRFRFPDVPEGAHHLGLALDQLPADFDPGKNVESQVVVLANRVARGELDVIRLAFIRGKIIGPPDTPLDSVVIRMKPGGRYTTPDRDGNFSFYNLREGDYRVSVDAKSLPEYGVLDPPDGVAVSVRLRQQAEPVKFRLEVHGPTKPVRKIAIVPPEAAEPRPRPEKGASATPAPKAAASALPASTLPASAADELEAANRHNSAGRDLLQAGQYQRAIRELNSAIRLAPDFALAYNARGFAWFKLRQYERAIEDLSRAIALNPGYANAYRIRGMARKAAGDPVGAVKDLELAAKLAN